MDSFELIKPSDASKICKKCNKICNAIRFQQKFKNWTSGNDNIDKFIQYTQLSNHCYDVREALEWIPYVRLCNIKYIAQDEFGKIYRANWTDGYIWYWDYKNQNWIREGCNMFVNLRSLNTPNILTLEFVNKINIEHEFYGITQDPETKNYMMVLNNICERCNYICDSILFQHKFIDWTSGNDDIDKFIKNTQLSAHEDVREALEWIPYDRLYNIKYIAKDEFGKVYRANWIDEYISNYDSDESWDNENQNWIREEFNMFVNLKNLNTPNILTLEFVDKIKIEHKLYGITQDPETKNYIMILNNICKKCNYVCDSIRFQHKFMDWTSGNDDIDKFIQDTQLSAHGNIEKALEWVSYDKFHNIKYIAQDEFSEVYVADWIDSETIYWDYKNRNWKRDDQNISVILKNLAYSENFTLELMKEINKPCGITQNSETKNYMIVLHSNKCNKCNKICNVIHFKQKFIDWTSGNNDIDKFIQDTQLSAHDNIEKALEWIPYDRLLYNIKYIAKDEFNKVYSTYWIDGEIFNWDYKNQNWKRENQNISVILKNLDYSKNITSEFMREINKSCGITWNPVTNRYMMVLHENKCNMCDKTCNAIYFQQKFIDWTSGNDNIDRFIQDTQLLAHKDVSQALEWIPYDRFYDIKYIAKGGFGKVYRANLTDGFITGWNSKDQNWERNGEDILVALKSLNNSKNITSEFINEIILHNKVGMENFAIVGFYGITQDPETKNYIMILDFAEDGSLRNYLDKEYSKLNWNKKFGYLRHIITGLVCIHEKELIHRDLHIGNILKFKYKTAITDMGLCKPANYNALENNIYGVLPYIAPEILRRQNYTKAADIYSFGIIMYEVISGLPPYHNLNHDNNLAINICKGLRPRFNIKVPQLIVHLIKRCLDANPLKRPIAKEINNILRRWENGSNEELQAQIKEADKINNNSLNNIIPLSNLGISYNTHSKASYISRLLDFNNLPEPKNSDDYYEQNDNKISKEYSESLQLSFSQLNINKSESCRINISQLNINENESCQINISQLNINDNDSCQINISQLNINDNESAEY
ncbi:hypothetical protein C1646_810057 [Rhizophagus diaphanus]|nr:hypothetical protein C1646_810057 [Rhizophagus diaphanus] [Rhizophagus sp. MUCL 43196]